MFNRCQTKPIYVGDVQIGGQNDVVIQSMTSTATQDIKSTVKQINDLADAGCQIVRLAINDLAAADAILQIKQEVTLPLVADIHFDYRLALAAIENGIDKIRINPGNIGSAEQVKAVVEAARAKNIPIRIGINSGSIEKKILRRDGKPTAKGMVESAINHINILEDLNYTNICISLKSTNVAMMIEANQVMAGIRNYPLHVGVTEAGTYFAGSIKSAVGIGTVLAQGIGDTIRVSLTGDPVPEIKVAREILKNLEIRDDTPTIISCPTCGRTKIDLLGLTNKVELLLEKIDHPLKVAIMGCVVNGPGEAREADVGVAGGAGEGVIFRKGEVVRKVKEEQLYDELVKEIEDILGIKLV